MEASEYKKKKVIATSIMTFFLPYIVINKLTVASYKSELSDFFFLRVLTSFQFWCKKNNYEFISHNSEKRGQNCEFFFFFWEKKSELQKIKRNLREKFTINLLIFCIIIIYLFLIQLQKWASITPSSCQNICFTFTYNWEIQCVNIRHHYKKYNTYF